VKATNKGRHAPVLPHGDQSVLVRHVLQVGRYSGAMLKQSLNLGNRNAVLLALRPVAVIPIESADPQIHGSINLYNCIYICGLGRKAKAQRLDLR
jgi:hypothetical protein